MLGRYTMKRGAKASELPSGVRQDTRKHTRHVLRPTPEMVHGALSGEMSWDDFAAGYRALIAARLRTERAGFDALAAQAREADVWLGCSCPTTTQPDVRRCHTWLALEVMRETYPDLDVRFPE
ncbi:MAG: hypothetical protein KC619_20460 [Myxococcales bacterium]|nr:hypothetical protein [Myxococcales bacterium]